MGGGDNLFIPGTPPPPNLGVPPKMGFFDYPDFCFGHFSPKKWYLPKILTFFSQKKVPPNILTFLSQKKNPKHFFPKILRPPKHCHFWIFCWWALSGGSSSSSSSSRSSDDTQNKQSKLVPNFVQNNLISGGRENTLFFLKSLSIFCISSFKFPISFTMHLRISPLRIYNEMSCFEKKFFNFKREKKKKKICYTFNPHFKGFSGRRFVVIHKKLVICWSYSMRIRVWATKTFKELAEQKKFFIYWTFAQISRRWGKKLYYLRAENPLEFTIQVWTSARLSPKRFWLSQKITTPQKKFCQNR